MEKDVSQPYDSGRARYFNRDGTNNIVRLGLSHKPWSDLYHGLLRKSWAQLLGMIVVLYTAANALFAVLYFADGGVENAHTFLDHFFFSVHTMMTIGYGTMSPRSLGANVLVAMQALLGLIGAAMTTGLFYGKFSLPTARVLFSRVAVISQRDGGPAFMFRMANERTNQVVEAELHVVLARSETTVEGEQIRRFHNMRLQRDRNAIFALTWTVVHPITPDSPLFGETLDTLKARRAEILISVVGIDETSSVTIHARSSYAPDEIIWGGRFADILSARADGKSQIDYSKFHDVVVTDPKMLS